MTIYPDFAAKTLTPRQLQEAIETKGCAVIRDLLPTDLLTAWRERIEYVFAYADEEFAANRLPPELVQNLFRFGNVHTRMLDTQGGVAYSLLHDMLLRTQIRNLLHVFFGPEFANLLRFSHPRRQLAKDIQSGVPYHQDAAFMGAHYFALNCWTPLVSCGVDAPGLEVILDGRRKFRRPANADDTTKHPYDQMSFEEKEMRDCYGEDKFWRPALNLGDILLFTNFTFHRTYHTPEMTKDRISLEIRCTQLTPELEKAGYSLGIIREGTNELQIVKHKGRAGYGA